MTGTKLLSWAMVATYAVVGVASSQLMLCYHRDGGTQIELAALRCCETPADPKVPEGSDCCGESSSAPCPDDQCQDVSLTLVIPQVSLVAPALDLAAMGIEFGVAEFPVRFPHAPVAFDRDCSHSRDHPPESGSKEFLRTVILRL
jgi:hypothetical protein